MAQRPIGGFLATALFCCAVSAQAQSLDLSSSTIVDLTHPFDAQHDLLADLAVRLRAQAAAQRPDQGRLLLCGLQLLLARARRHASRRAPPFRAGPLDQRRYSGRALRRPGRRHRLSAKAAENSDYRLTAGRHRRLRGRAWANPEGAIVLLRTGWSKRWGDRKAYLGDDTPGDASHLHFPGLRRGGGGAAGERAPCAADRPRHAPASIMVRRRISLCIASSRRRMSAGSRISPISTQLPPTGADRLRFADEDRGRHGRPRADHRRDAALSTREALVRERRSCQPERGPLYLRPLRQRAPPATAPIV